MPLFRFRADVLDGWGRLYGLGEMRALGGLDSLGSLFDPFQ